MANRWFILGLLFITRISLGFQFQTMGSTSDKVIYELALNYAEIGTLIGLFMLPGLFLAIPAGLAGNFFSDKALIGFGLIALSLGGTIAGLSQGFGFLSLGRVICGIGFVVSTIFFAKVLIDWFDGKELATAMSIGHVLAFWDRNGTSWPWVVVGFFRLALGFLYCFIILRCKCGSYDFTLLWASKRVEGQW